MQWMPAQPIDLITAEYCQPTGASIGTFATCCPAGIKIRSSPSFPGRTVVRFSTSCGTPSPLCWTIGDRHLTVVLYGRRASLRPRAPPKLSDIAQDAVPARSDMVGFLHLQRQPYGTAPAHIRNERRGTQHAKGTLRYRGCDAGKLRDLSVSEAVRSVPHAGPAGSNNAGPV